MKLGFSGEAFGNLLVISGITGIAIMIVIFIIAYKRGIDITKHRFALSLVISYGIIFVVAPFWLSELSVKWKIMGTSLMLAVGIGNYFAIDKMQRAIRERRSKKQERNKESSP